MNRFHGIVVLLTLTTAVMYAGSPQADAARRRVEQSAARQQQALAGMSGAIASQERSVQRQPRVEWPAQTFAFRPASLEDFHGGAAFTEPMAPPMFGTTFGTMLGTMFGTAYTPGSGPFYNPVSNCDALPKSQVDSLVSSAAKQTSVPADLIRSVMRQESGFRACAVSSKGAMGLMQLEPGTANDLGVTDAFDPEANVMGGARLLRQLLNRYGGDVGLTLGAYNAGPARVDAAMGIPMIPETMDYVSRILSRLTENRPSALPAAALGEGELGEGEESADGNSALNGEDQLLRNSASATSFWLTGSAGGK